MTMTCRWEFQLEAEDKGAVERVVKCIHYCCTGSDGTHSGEYIGIHEASAPGPTFVAWADLTPEIVKDWLGAGLIAQVEASVAAQIAAKAEAAANNRIVGVPWA